MKNTFKQLLQESTKQYEFKIRIANTDVNNEMVNKLEIVLKAYDLTDISKPKTIPVTEQPLFFPNLGPCEVTDMNVIFNYPCTTEQIRQLIINSCKISTEKIVVLPKDFDESQYISMAKDEKKKALLDTELEDNGVVGADYYGDKHIGSFLKSLKELRFSVDNSKTPAAKTTNDTPQYTVSPVNKPNFREFKDIFKDIGDKK